MKPLGIALIALVMMGLGYQVAYPKMFEEGFFPPRHITSDKEASVSPATPKTDALPKSLPTPVAAPAPTAKAPTITDAAPAPVMIPVADKPNPTPAPVADDPNTFHPPVFPPIEQVVKDWTAIPQTVFPHPVKIRHEVAFTMAAGRSTVAAGGVVIALNQSGSMLDVAPALNSPARGRVALDDTDLKASLTQAYEEWKTATIELKRRDFANRGQDRRVTTPQPSPTVASKNDKPIRNGDGTYPVLLDSMKRGQVTEITPNNIASWSEVTWEKIDGKSYWIVKVKYTVPSIVGPIDTEAEAHLFNGRVEKWIYTKSREVVP